MCVIQNDEAYPELDLDDVMKIDESSREQKLEVHKHLHCIQYVIRTYLHNVIANSAVL